MQPLVGIANISDDRDETGEPDPYAVLTFNVQLLRFHVGYSFQDDNFAVFGGLDKTFKLMDRERTRPIWERMVVDRFAFDVELLFLASRFGLKIAEIPVRWRDDPQTRVGLVGDPARMFADLIRIRWRFRRGGYNP